MLCNSTKTEKYRSVHSSLLDVSTLTLDFLSVFSISVHCFLSNLLFAADNYAVLVFWTKKTKKHLPDVILLNI